MLHLKQQHKEVGNTGRGWLQQERPEQGRVKWGMAGEGWCSRSVGCCRKAYLPGCWQLVKSENTFMVTET